MNRRALILNELGLNPQWIRHAVLQTLSTQVTAAPAELSPIEVVAPAHLTAAPQPTPTEPVTIQRERKSTKAAAAHRLLQQNREAADPNNKTLSSEEIRHIDARSERIAELSWEELRVEIAGCTACPRSQQRQQAVFATGAIEAKLLIVSDAPSKVEEQHNLAIFGPSQRMLNQMLVSLGEEQLQNSLITNAVKCHGSRNPNTEEIKACAPLLQRQIALLKPTAILAIGQSAAESVLNTSAPIRELRQLNQQCQNIPTIVTYHPSYLQRNVHDKAKTWQDLLRLKKIFQ
ncbi:uracil-DNA glycosylase [Deefgea salmonis]|uniref:Uracil-DNA glycosylase n=1 Tax=Deefgea salmonis TaxID=2875502 RepID=A0ABS8BKI6_9NEIS|nr:uracil-DNA glycosylase [Deefgea salmonis]MCB5196234.1 uracil-DNA glycosylase [Deefgea salmonis]